MGQENMDPNFVGGGMYRDIIIDYYKNPRNFGQIQKPTLEAKDSNPLCGDAIQMQIKLNNGKIADAKFSGKGCAISQASASMLTEILIGKTTEEAKKIDKQKILELLGIQLGPVRIKCALLGLKVLKMCLYNLGNVGY